MVEVKIEKMCGCVKKAKMEQITTFENMETAKKEAEALAQKMDKTFCQKHNFKVEENSDGNLTIKVGMN